MPTKDVDELCLLGNKFANAGKYEQALSSYQNALKLLPNTDDYVEERIWLFTSIGDMLFQLKRFYEAIIELEKAYIGEVSNPFIHLRLGQCYYEVNNTQKATEHLLQAFMLDGPRIFEGENFKYFNYIKPLVR